MDHNFSADKLFMTKAQILGVGEKLIQRWKKNERANKKMILITQAAQFLVAHYKAEEIEMYYKEFWKEAYEVMYQNALAGMPELSKLAQVSTVQPAVSELDFSLKKLLTMGMMK